jgi:hypothetical protein
MTSGKLFEEATNSTLSGCDQGMQRTAAAGPQKLTGSGVYTA